MPMSIGGKIKTLEDIEKRLRIGADKVINTMAFKSSNFVKNAAKEFGSQCIVVSIDVKLVNDLYEVFVNCGRKATGLNPFDYAKSISDSGAGEILINSIDRDGVGQGYDINLLKRYQK